MPHGKKKITTTSTTTTTTSKKNNIINPSMVIAIIPCMCVCVCVCVFPHDFRDYNIPLSRQAFNG